jgi:hypothetical protein
LMGQKPARILEETGWARSVGGSGPYLGLRARCGAGREAIDRAAADLEIRELPAARGCTYVVPRSAFGLALKLARGCGLDADMKVARKLGVTDAEVDKLSQAVLDALQSGAMDPEQMRSATGGAARNLGEAGKKGGMITTLPLALGRRPQGAATITENLVSYRANSQNPHGGRRHGETNKISGATEEVKGRGRTGIRRNPRGLGPGSRKCEPEGGRAG